MSTVHFLAFKNYFIDICSYYWMQIDEYWVSIVRRTQHIEHTKQTERQTYICHNVPKMNRKTQYTMPGTRKSSRLFFLFVFFICIYFEMIFINVTGMWTCEELVPHLICLLYGIHLQQHMKTHKRIERQDEDTYNQYFVSFFFSIFVYCDSRDPLFW